MLNLGEFNLPGQNGNLFSLQGSEMFIDTIAHRKVFAPLGARLGGATIGKASKRLRSYGARSKERNPPSYKHLAPMGRNHEQDHLLHFKSEVAFNNRSLLAASSSAVWLAAELNSRLFTIYHLRFTLLTVTRTL